MFDSKLSFKQTTCLSFKYVQCTGKTTQTVIIILVHLTCYESHGISTITVIKI